MIADDLESFAAALPAVGVVVGLDLGTKTIGVAISDALRGVATPAQVIRRRKFTQDAEALEALMAARGAVGIVLGLPLNMDGTEGPRVQSSRAFARNLDRRGGGGGLNGGGGPPIAFWDERLSTVAAERALLEADASRRRRAAVIDAVAASYILQGALDRMRNIALAGR